ALPLSGAAAADRRRERVAPAPGRLGPPVAPGGGPLARARGPLLDCAGGRLPVLPHREPPRGAVLSGVRRSAPHPRRLLRGDAVMGVFGAPVAHDDDPARAVRAALRILDSMEELRRADPGLAVRVAVNTGEAMVSFGAGPQIGEAIAGDVVNTASRMQGLAAH